MVAEEGGDVDLVGGEVVEVEGVEPETWEMVSFVWGCDFGLSCGIGLGGNVWGTYLGR